MKAMNNRKDDPMRTDRDLYQPGEVVVYHDRIARLARLAARTYPRHDVIDGATGAVAHLSHLTHVYTYGWTYGHWYALCGRVVLGYRVANLAETDFDKVCRSCERAAEKKQADDLTPSQS